MGRAEKIVIRLSWISRFSSRASNFLFSLASRLPTTSKKVKLKFSQGNTICQLPKGKLEFKFFASPVVFFINKVCGKV